MCDILTWFMGNYVTSAHVVKILAGIILSLKESYVLKK